MPIGAIGAAVGGVSSLLGGVLGGNASGQASKQYVQGLQQAQQSLTQSEGQALGNLSPYLQAGSQATGTLSQMLGTPGQGLLTPWTQQFTAPTAAQAAQTPGYQFQVQQGEQALQNSAAAQGGLLSGGTLAGLNNYAQGVASENYQNTFNNALTQYQSAYNTFLNNQARTYGMLSGQSAQGLSAAGEAGNIVTGIGGDIASLYGQGGAARAQGTIGSANAWSNALGGISNAATGYLSQMGPTSGPFGFSPSNPLYSGMATPGIIQPTMPSLAEYGQLTGPGA